MAKKRKNKDKPMVISGEELRKKTKSRDRIPFSTGGHMTEKDRPRKKRWSLDDE